MKPTISVIMPFYNRADLLAETLDSILAQTYTDFELIGVDDGSTDNAVEIFKNYANKDARLKLYQKRHTNAGDARNLGYKHSTGDYLMFLDSDDWLELNACELLYNKISQNDNDFVYFNYYRYYESTGKLKVFQNKLIELTELADTDHIEPAKLKKPFACSSESWFKIYKTDFIVNNNLQFLTEQNFEDQIFYTKAFCLAKTVSVVNKPLLYYRQRKSSISHDKKYWQDVPKSWELVLKNIPENAADMCKDSILLNSINSLLFWFKRYGKINSEVRAEFYSALHRLFQEYDKDAIERLKK